MIIVFMPNLIDKAVTYAGPSLGALSPSAVPFDI